jgi:drug/metabolite transporter (DMT)-like permease
MSVNTQPSAKARFSVANHIGHGLGLLISAGNLWVVSDPVAREGDGYNGNVWIAGLAFSVIAVVALLASWITKASAPRRIGGIALVLLGVASLGVLFVPDIGTVGRIANSVSALVHFGAAALVLLPSRRHNQV